jgi:hypothetical protein
METHSERIERVRREYREAHDRFVTRLAGAPPDAVARVPAVGGWSALLVGWHVAAVDASFAGLMSGEVPAATELPEGVTAAPWPEIAAAIPAKIEAGKRVQPPPAPDRDGVLAALAESAAKIDAALAGLAEDRAVRLAITHPVVGVVALAYIGDWAVAHTIRHNAQAKRVLGF